MTTVNPSLTWIPSGGEFPPVDRSWSALSDAPGLLAAGSDLDANTLKKAYSNGIFPWYSEGQPILWWSPDPRMVLICTNFRLHRSLKKTLIRFKNDIACEIRFNSAFEQVIKTCANMRRRGPPGTWIVPEMVDAYICLHAAGFAHSVETWINNQLVGGLYCVAIGGAVFGESMFTLRPDASKIALAALVGFCIEHDIPQIDCQQKTAHLASMGAYEMPRSLFIANMIQAQHRAPPDWKFSHLYWNNILSST
jgi:leucyl/phenylalanyl-tRNA--protein transferase